MVVLETITSTFLKNITSFLENDVMQTVPGRGRPKYTLAFICHLWVRPKSLSGEGGEGLNFITQHTG